MTVPAPQIFNFKLKIPGPHVENSRAARRRTQAQAAPIQVQAGTGTFIGKFKLRPSHCGSLRRLLLAACQ